jgi:hypothetical protein
LKCISHKTPLFSTISLFSGFPQWVAAALEINAPDLFSMKMYPLEEPGSIKEFQERVISDMAQVLSYRLKELVQDAALPDKAVANGHGSGDEPKLV